MREMAIGNLVTLVILWTGTIVLIAFDFEMVLFWIFLTCNAIMSILSAAASTTILRAPKAIA